MQFDNWEKIRSLLKYDEGIQGRNEYFNSAVLLLLVQVEGSMHFLFQKRAAKVRQPGEICFPGGRIEIGKETHAEAALRETEEELGIDKNRIQIIASLKSLVTPSGSCIDGFVGTSDIRLDELAINEHEVESVFTIPVNFFLNNNPEHHSVRIRMHPDWPDKHTGKVTTLLPSKDLGLPDIYHEAWGQFNYPVLVYKTTNGVIWGITARLIYEFCTMISAHDHTHTTI